MYYNLVDLFSKLSESTFYKEISKYRGKSIRFAVLRGIP